LTISVRLSEKVENILRADAIKENKNISDIVNHALEKYQNEYKYFDSINAHHLDPVMVKVFFELADTPEKIQKISDAGSIMTKKYIKYKGISNDSLQTQLDSIEEFLKLHSIKISQRIDHDNIVIVGVHEFGVIFSQILCRGISKVIQSYSKKIEMEFDEGTFTLKILKKQNNF
jgi:hypothetical protein